MEIKSGSIPKLSFVLSPFLYKIKTSGALNYLCLPLCPLLCFKVLLLGQLLHIRVWKLLLILCWEKGKPLIE